MWMLLAWIGAASAGDDGALRREAEEALQLDFDLDSVQGELRRAKYAAPAAAPPYDGAINPGYLATVAALPLAPNSDVAQVVVFRDRALVTRVRKVDVLAGETSVAFEGLPLGIDASSLDARVHGGDAKIVGVELVSGTGDVEETAAIAEVRARAEALADDLGAVRDRVESLLAQRAYLRGAVIGGDSRPSLAEVKGTLAYVGDAERDIAAQLRAEQDKAEKLAEALTPLLTRLRDPIATGRTVRIDVAEGHGGKVEVELRYQVFGAQWAPTYDARLDDATGQVTLEYAGLVSQATGELWDNAEILLSTADPAAAGQLPELSTWYLGRYGSGTGDLADGKGYYDEPTNAYNQMPTANGEVSSTMSAGVRGSGAVLFAIPGERTIRGDGSSQRLPIGTQTFQAALSYASVPKVVSSVFRSAKVTYQGEAPLLPGAVSSYVGGDFVGGGFVDTIVPGQELLLSFGTDPSVEVKRTLVSRHVEAAPGKRVRYDLYFRVDLANYGKTARTVTVTDQIPVAELERTTVALGDTTPPLADEPNAPPGVLKWQVELAPGAKKSIDLRFSVTAPREAGLGELDALY